MILPRIYTATQVSLANAELARLEALENAGPAAKAGRNPFEGFHTGRIYALADKSRVFDCFPIHPAVLALNDYFLQPNYLMTSFHTVNIRPGAREQNMHTDDGLIELPRPRPLMGVVCFFYGFLFSITDGLEGVMVDLWMEMCRLWIWTWLLLIK